MQITDVCLFEVRGPWTWPTFPPGNRQIQPLDLYPEFNQPLPDETSTSASQQIRATYVEILTDSDISGLFGPIEPPQVDIIKHMLRHFCCNLKFLFAALSNDDRVAPDKRMVSDDHALVWDEQPRHRLWSGMLGDAV